MCVYGRQGMILFEKCQKHGNKFSNMCVPFLFHAVSISITQRTYIYIYDAYASNISEIERLNLLDLSFLISIWCNIALLN